MTVIFKAIFGIKLAICVQQDYFEHFLLVFTPPSRAFSLISVLIKNQARLMLLILGSYSRVFYVFENCRFYYRNISRPVVIALSLSNNERIKHSFRVLISLQTLKGCLILVSEKRLLLKDFSSQPRKSKT